MTIKYYNAVSSHTGTLYFSVTFSHMNVVEWIIAGMAITTVSQMYVHALYDSGNHGLYEDSTVYWTWKVRHLLMREWINQRLNQLSIK